MAYDPIIDGESVAQAIGKINDTGSSSDSHINGAATNPHGTTKGDVGLGSVDNTPDTNKPVSTAQQAALDEKVGTSLQEGHVLIGDGSGEAVSVPITTVTNRAIDNTQYSSQLSAAWNTDYGNIDNSSSQVVVTLPNATAADIGKVSSFWIRNNPANNKVIFTAYDTNGAINEIGSNGTDKAKADFSANKPSYSRIAVYCMGEGDYHIDDMSSVYNTLRYTVNFDATSDYGPYSYLQLSEPVTNLMTNNGDWWFAVKIEQPMTPDSDGHVLFGSNNFWVGYRGNGTYLMTSSTSGYLQAVSPNTIVEAGSWMIYQFDQSANRFTAWINENKILDASTSGATPPSTAPTEMWFGSETGQSSPPSGYGYPLQQCKISCISAGTGNLSDADAALFTPSQYRVPTITSATLVGEWISDGSSMSNVVGNITMSDVGTNISHSGI